MIDLNNLQKSTFINKDTNCHRKHRRIFKEFSKTGLKYFKCSTEIKIIKLVSS